MNEEEEEKEEDEKEKENVGKNREYGEGGEREGEGGGREREEEGEGEERRGDERVHGWENRKNVVQNKREGLFNIILSFWRVEIRSLSRMLPIYLFLDRNSFRGE